MRISSAKRVGPQYKFFKAGPDRDNSFVIIPKSMIDPEGMDNVKADWSRVVAFGDVAEIINSMYNDGVTLFKLAQGRIRDNSLERQDGTIFASAEIVAEELDTKDWNKLVKKFAGTGEYHGEGAPEAV